MNLVNRTVLYLDFVQIVRLSEQFLNAEFVNQKWLCLRLIFYFQVLYSVSAEYTFVNLFQSVVPVGHSASLTESVYLRFY